VYDRRNCENLFSTPATRGARGQSAAAVGTRDARLNFSIRIVPADDTTLPVSKRKLRRVAVSWAASSKPLLATSTHLSARRTERKDACKNYFAAEPVARESKAVMLTEAQLATITAAAKPLHARDRSPFLEAVATVLAQYPERGDGLAHRIGCELQSRYLHAAPNMLAVARSRR
jgi:hypothetical protein